MSRSSNLKATSHPYVVAKLPIASNSCPAYGHPCTSCDSASPKIEAFPAVGSLRLEMASNTRIAELLLVTPHDDPCAAERKHSALQDMGRYSVVRRGWIVKDRKRNPHANGALAGMR